MEREKVEESNLEDVVNERLKNEEDQKAVDMDLIEKLKLDFLLLNLHQLSKYRAESMTSPLLVTQYEILQNVCGNVKDFHGLIVNACIKHDMVENVLPLFQLMAERVGRFLWEDQTDEEKDDQTDEDSRLVKLAHLLLEIAPIELEVMHICYTNLKASTSAEVGRFIKQLLETSPDILREYLIHLQQHMVTVIIASTPGARNIHVMMEFLLIILTDMPRDLIHHDKFFDLLARVGVLTREVLALVNDIEEKSWNKESTNETNCATLDLQENIELLKKDLKHVYLKAPNSSQCFFPMSDGPLFMHLLHIHLDDLLDSDAYSVALIKEEIALVKQDLEFIRSFFMNVERRLYEDLWAHVLDVAYEARDVIDSIIVRDNGLLHIIFSLPITMKKIEIIKEDISNLLDKIPKNNSLIVVNTPKKAAESKSLATGKITVGFEEETNWVLRKLTSGPADLDVISITGMPGSGKTTLAYKVYNDKSVSSHSTKQHWFPKLDFLTELEHLAVKFESGSSAATNWSQNFHFPLNLKILRLAYFALTYDALSTIARLPNLEELSLDDAIIEGGEWNMGEEDTFENLKYLNLHRVTLAKWGVGEESFPVLEKLKLHGCRKLEEIPPCFGDINSLKVIKLVNNPHLEESAKNIKQYAEDIRARGEEVQVVGRKNISLFN